MKCSHQINSVLKKITTKLETVQTFTTFNHPYVIKYSVFLHNYC